MQMNYAKFQFGILGALFLLARCPLGVRAAPEELDACNVTWKSPGKSSADSMPLGNGELGINLWVEQGGDLLFYLSRNDTHSENGPLCKAGKVRVSLSPNPFTTGTLFRQELKLRDGVCEITAGEGNARVQLKVFVDAARPVVHVLGESAAPVTVAAKVESWRTDKQRPKETPVDLWTPADVFPAPQPHSVAWYHRNEESPAFDSSIKLQSLESIRGALRDPLLRRTFGGWVAGDGFVSRDNRTLVSSAPVKAFALRVASPCAQTQTPEEWLKLAESAAKQSADAKTALTQTAATWRAFWERSWVVCGKMTGEPVPENAQPVRFGPFTSGTQTLMTLGEVALSGRPLLPEEVLAHAKGAPKTAAQPKAAVPKFEKGLSIEAWIKPEKGAEGRFNVVSKRTSSNPDGFFLDHNPPRGLRFCVGNRMLASPANVLTPGEWQHVAATYDAKSAMQSLYVNGALVAGIGSEEMTIGKGYVWQRYMQACAGRGGNIPIKFNGSIFTVEPAPLGKPENPDWRRYGEAFWWQNTRLPYHSMLGSGDYDLMMPLFNFYESIRPLSEARAKIYYGAEGCYFPEVVSPWGTYRNRDYGLNRKGQAPGDVQCQWWRYAWNQGPELVSLMLDYYDHTGDEKFLKERLLPMAVSVLKYFDTRFRKDEKGRIVVDPAQVVETYWEGVVNDTPTVAGLNAVPTRLCALPGEALSADQRAFFEHMKAAAPEIAMERATLNGKNVRRISAAQKFNPKRSNCENGETYAIWPFRVFGLGRPLLEEARNTFALRFFRGTAGWNYDCNLAAVLGLTEEAASNLKSRAANSNGMYRWPATWGPNYDWLPDQCHGGNLMTMTNYMLLQDAGGKILLFPAWPRDWDVSFKLHAPKQTVVEATLRAGKICRLKVTPESRRKDIVIDPVFQGVE